MTDEIKVIDIDAGKGGIHLVNANEQLSNEFPDITFEKKDDSKFGGFVTDDIDLKKNEAEIKKIYERLDERPLKYIYASCFTPTYFGIDWSKKPDCAGRVTYWIAPFKYKTAGFDHFTVNSEFGMVWRLFDYPGINLKDLPINYNFDMAKEFYKNWSNDLLSLFKRHFRLFINGLYGKYMYNACNIPSSWYSPSVYQDMVAWMSGKNRYYVARGTCKHER